MADLFDIRMILLTIPSVLLALTFHEFAHGLVALWRGDPTAQSQGRLSLNPLAHLDPLGTIMLLFFHFGWAKPVPVNSYNFKNPRQDIILVSLAGPVSNLLLAVVAGCFTHFVLIPYFNVGQSRDVMEFIQIFILINIGLAGFNLLPFPPLDGSNVLLAILPQKHQLGYLKATRYVPFIFLGMMLIQNFSGGRLPLLSLILWPIYVPFYPFWSWVTFGG